EPRAQALAALELDLGGARVGTNRDDLLLGQQRNLRFVDDALEQRAPNQVIRYEASEPCAAAGQIEEMRGRPVQHARRDERRDLVVWNTLPCAELAQPADRRMRQRDLTAVERGLSETLARLPLDDRDVESARRERQRERKARGPRADHGDVEAARAHHRTDTNAATRRMRRRFKTEDTRKSRMVEPQAAARCPSLDAASMTVYR